MNSPPILEPILVVESDVHRGIAIWISTHGHVWANGTARAYSADDTPMSLSLPEIRLSDFCFLGLDHLDHLGWLKP